MCKILALTAPLFLSSNLVLACETQQTAIQKCVLCNVVIDWNGGISIEYVGQGFDGGKLTKGKNRSHTSVYIPWHISEWPAEFIWDFAKIQNIDQNMYSASREQRIQALSEFGYPIDVEKEAILLEPVYMSKDFFINIFRNCVKEIVKYFRDFDSKFPTMILIDLYGNKQHVVEIWNSNR